MLTKDIPMSTQKVVEFVKDHRNRVAESVYWGLLLETEDTDGDIVAEMMSFNGRLNPNAVSFWLLVDMLPMSFATDSVFNWAIIDLTRIDWLVDALGWIPDISNYDPDRHVNHSVAEEVCKLMKSEHDLQLKVEIGHHLWRA